MKLSHQVNSISKNKIQFGDMDEAERSSGIYSILGPQCDIKLSEFNERASQHSQMVIRQSESKSL